MPIYLFRINVQTVDRYGWVQPNRTTLDGNEMVTEESELAATRSTWLPSLFAGVENIALHDGNYIRAYGAKATYLMNTYVTGSVNDVLIPIPDLGFVGPNNDLGSNWTFQNGSFTVDYGNQARGTVTGGNTIGGGNSATYLGISALNPSMSAYIKLNPVEPTSIVGLIARSQDATDINNCYFMAMSSAEAVVIAKVVGGVITVLASVFTTLNAGMLEFTVSGTTLTGYLNGAQVLMVTDSTYTGPGSIGILDIGGGGLISQFTLTY
jgi:hypothetical protein